MLWDSPGGAAGALGSKGMSACCCCGAYCCPNGKMSLEGGGTITAPGVGEVAACPLLLEGYWNLSELMGPVAGGNSSCCLNCC